MANFKVTAADKKYNTEAWKRLQKGMKGYEKAKVSPRDKKAPGPNA
tara:strand:- start:140 stop:277 length:138 start_codon:yes stop_codon:yes gene_type:complete